MKRKWIVLIAVLVFLTVGIKACKFNRPIATSKAQSAIIIPVQRTKVKIGVWNGPTASMYVAESGVKLIFSCGEGSIYEPLILDDSNRFTARGTYFERGGRVMNTEYTGVVYGNQPAYFKA